MSRLRRRYILQADKEHPYSIKGYVPQHRLVVEKYIARFLNPTEVVHHIDEDKQNNHITNLMVFQTNREHIKWHTKLRQYRYTTTPMKKIIEERWVELEKLDWKLGRERFGKIKRICKICENKFIPDGQFTRCCIPCRVKILKERKTRPKRLTNTLKGGKNAIIQ